MYELIIGSISLQNVRDKRGTIMLTKIRKESCSLAVSEVLNPSRMLSIYYAEYLFIYLHNIWLCPYLILNETIHDQKQIDKAATHDA